jgi:hypothetical protein
MADKIRSHDGISDRETRSGRKDRCFGAIRNLDWTTMGMKWDLCCENKMPKSNWPETNLPQKIRYSIKKLRYVIILITRYVISVLTDLTTCLCSQPVQFTLHILAKLLLNVMQVKCSVHFLSLCLINSTNLDEKRKLLNFLSITCFFLGVVFSVVLQRKEKCYTRREIKWKYKLTF